MQTVGLLNVSFWTTCKGPSQEELHLAEDVDVLLERGRRRRKEEGQRWEERLQENWENCLVSQLFVCFMLVDWAEKENWFASPGVKLVLPRLGRPLPAGELFADPPSVDPCGKTTTDRQFSHEPEFCASAKVEAYCYIIMTFCSFFRYFLMVVFLLQVPNAKPAP